MPLRQDYIHEMCQGFTSFVEQLPYTLSLKYIFHHRGQRNDAIALENRFFQSHPAGSIALNILRKCQSTQNSSFHGLAVETTQSMMGLKEQRNALGLITINLDNHSTTESALHEAYHLGWMAIDTARLLQHPKYKNSLKSGSLIPKRSALNFTKSSLQADIFSVLILADQGFDNMIKSIATQRCLDTMLPKINGHPWDYPYPLAYETTWHTWKNVIDKKSPTYHSISTALQFSASIASTIEEEAYQHWWNFCKPAQAMAWHDETPDYILSAASQTSEDPIIKVTSFLIQDCTNLDPSKETLETDRYNAFISVKQNKIYHEKAVDETFELVLQKSLQEQSAQAFIDTANSQNKNLSEGKVFGWCASALHAVARIYETAQKEGLGDASRMITLGFKASQQEIKYSTLVNLGENIIEKRRKGEVITLEDVEKMARSQIKTEFVSASLQKTIKDPAYVQSLKITQELDHVHILEPQTSPPKVAPAMAQTAPTSIPQVAIGGMGGRMGGGMMGGTSTTAPPLSSTDLVDTEETKRKKAE